jgi:hypothetical protein
VHNPRIPKTHCVELPKCPESELMAVVNEHRELFRTTPGVTEAAYHYIPTTGSPVRVYHQGIFQPITKKK